MIEASKDPEINKIRFRSSNRPFQNSTCVFAEYVDIIQIPWFTLLTFLKDSTGLEGLFNFEEIRYLSPQALLNHYFNREHRNPLIEFISNPKDIIVYEDNDRLLDDLVNGSEIFFNPDLDTFVTPMVNNLISNSLIDKLVIYYPTENEFVKADVFKKFGTKAQCVFGDLTQVLQDIPTDTTYIFSDVLNVLKLEELKKINYSAIMLPLDYRYNFTDNSKEKYIVDMDYLSEKYTFKWSIFRIA